MTKAYFLAFPLTLALGFSLPAASQETAAPATAATATETPAPAPVPAQAPGIAESAEKAEIGQPYVGPTNGDWKSRCFKAPDGGDPCEAIQVLTDGTLTQNGQLNQVAEFSLFDLPDGGDAVLGAVIIAPLETALQAGLALQIDGGAAKLYPYSFCTIAGCIARIGFTAADVAELKKGNEAKLLIVPAAAPDQQVNIKVSLTGITAAIDALPQVPNEAKQ
jgi:invasion protein IalB